MTYCEGRWSTEGEGRRGCQSIEREGGLGRRSTEREGGKETEVVDPLWQMGVVEVRLGWVRERREGGGWGGGDGLTVVARWVRERRVRRW